MSLSQTGEISPLGFVLRSPDHQSFELDLSEPIVVRDGVVKVTLLSPGVPDGGHSILDKQTRNYRLQDGDFRQVSGPTKFAQPPSDPAKTDFANTTVQIDPPAGSGIVRLTSGTGSARFGETRYSVTMVRSEVVGTGEDISAVVLYRLADPAGVVSELIEVYKFGLSSVPADHLFIGVTSGRDGIAHIQTFDAVGQDIKVTVELTGGGTQVRTYREKTPEWEWERVS